MDLFLQHPVVLGDPLPDVEWHVAGAGGLTGGGHSRSVCATTRSRAPGCNGMVSIGSSTCCGVALWLVLGTRLDSSIVSSSLRGPSIRGSTVPSLFLPLS